MWILVSKEKLEKMEKRLGNLERCVESLMYDSVLYTDGSRGEELYHIPQGYQVSRAVKTRRVVELLVEHLGLKLEYKPEERKQEQFLLLPAEPKAKK